MKTRHRLLVLALLTAQDLHGQPVVRVYAAADKAPARWTVGPSPSLEIGGGDATGSAEFARIVGVSRQSNGSVIVADATSSELRVFYATGRFRELMARRGQGPGELPGLDAIAAVGDTIMAIESRHSVHVFGPDGTWLRSLKLPLVPGYIVNPAIGALTSVDAILRLRSGSLDSLRQIRRDSIWVARISLRDTTVRILAAQALPPAWALPGQQPTYPLGFAPATLHATGNGRLCLGYPARYTVTCHDSLGRVQFEIRREVRRRAVHDSARRALRYALSGRRPDGSSRFEGSLREHRERVADATQFAAEFPAYSQLMLSRTGELWVRTFLTADGINTSQWRSNHAPSDWSVYDRTGRWIADCRLPARFAPAEIGADYVIGVSQDDDDVERVTLWPLRR